MLKFELKKRIITSLFLFSLLTLMFFYNFVLIISLIVIVVCAWIEFYALIAKILTKENSKNKVIRFTYKTISLIYLTTLIYFIIIIKSLNYQLEDALIYSILVSILTDIGGLITGKIFKGKKLTKISPKKTISGALGSFLFSLMLVHFLNRFSLNLITLMFYLLF